MLKRFTIIIFVQKNIVYIKSQSWLRLVYELLRQAYDNEMRRSIVK